MLALNLVVMQRCKAGWVERWISETESSLLVSSGKDWRDDSESDASEGMMATSMVTMTRKHGLSNNGGRLENISEFELAGYQLGPCVDEVRTAHFNIVSLRRNHYGELAKHKMLLINYIDRARP
jgi:hypothetical protein